MLSVPTQVWNRIAKTESLDSKFGRIMFRLPEKKLEAAIAEANRTLRAKGLNPEAARAFLEIAPLLKEHRAIAACARKYETTLPSIETVDEAMHYLTREVPSLSKPQATLARQLFLDLK